MVGGGPPSPRPPLGLRWWWVVGRHDIADLVYKTSGLAYILAHFPDSDFLGVGEAFERVSKPENRSERVPKRLMKCHFAPRGSDFFPACGGPPPMARSASSSQVSRRLPTTTQVSSQVSRRCGQESSCVMVCLVLERSDTNVYSVLCRL